MPQQSADTAASFAFRRLNYVKGEQNELDDYHYKIGDCRCPAQSLSGLVTYQEGSVCEPRCSQTRERKCNAVRIRQGPGTQRTYLSI